MTAAPISAWAELDRRWLYLGRSPADGFDIATLVTADARRIAPLFTSEDDAAPFLDAAPRGVELLVVDAGDLRAKEEWLRAVLAQAAADLAFNPDPGTLATEATLSVAKALWYILSQRRATACL